MDRRQFLQLVGMSAAAGMLGGCFSRESTPTAEDSGSLTLTDKGLFAGGQGAPESHPLLPPKVGPKLVGGVPGPCATKITALSRQRWQADSPLTNRLNPMGSVRLVTVHHEGNPRPNNDSTPAEVASDLRKIQIEHRQRMKAGDIGYHFIVDRSGRIWQGRDVRYQGAHVSAHNSNNIGIMCLGNFELQQPTSVQLASLRNLCQTLLHGYSLPVTSLHVHSDLASTCCPGRNLKPCVTNIKRALA